eukprot:gnl/MRDRNA2_/MRDRNA2_75306_c0_seq2.p1 gnl/MRDRNA2_/MRDRNA2_75306_c0~~gnl/MRDRNA2_/MRDRNA2_75306_c0_seq2.p1  ORF type:complete len:506 (-),score=67.80 gnl/MRDRNA2_/MRDRNA2_75306_c0_seq2:12-1505(-)
MLRPLHPSNQIDDIILRKHASAFGRRLSCLRQHASDFGRGRSRSKQRCPYEHRRRHRSVSSDHQRRASPSWDPPPKMPRSSSFDMSNNIKAVDPKLSGDMPKSRSEEDEENRTILDVGKQESQCGPRERGQYKKETMELFEGDIPVIMGKSGATMRKLEDVSGAYVQLNRQDTTLEIWGEPEERERAMYYVKLFIAQRCGVVRMDFQEERQDRSLVIIPEALNAYIFGKMGATLKTVEDACGVIIFFVRERSDSADPSGKQVDVVYKEKEKLAIFGPRRCRRAAELKLMAAVEYKKPGCFIHEDGFLRHKFNQPGDDDDEAYWGCQQFRMRRFEFAYALGPGGCTKKKIARAANCVIEYVGFTAIMCGTRSERRLAVDYLDWLLRQRVGRFNVNFRDRDDCSVVTLPAYKIDLVTETKNAALRKIEESTGTFILVDRAGFRDIVGPRKSFEDIVICSSREKMRREAAYLLAEEVDRKLDRKGDTDYNGGYRQVDETL